MAPPGGTVRPRRPVDVPGVTRPLRYNELVGTQGGFTPLHFAARQGTVEVVKALWMPVRTSTS